MLNILNQPLSRYHKGTVAKYATARHSDPEPKAKGKNLYETKILRSALGLPQDDKIGISQQSHKSGTILLISLWMLFLLTILTLGISSRVASEISFAKFLDERIVSLYLAKAGVNKAILELEKDKTPGYDTLYELRQMREIDFNGNKLAYNLLDEERLININFTPQEIIARLPGMTVDLAREVFIARSKQPLAVKEELLLIDGLTPEIYGQFKDMITVYGSGAVNINTASPDILRILGLGDDIIDPIIQYRAGDDSKEQTKDDGKYTSLPVTIPEPMRFLFGIGSQDTTVDITTYMLARHQSHYRVVISRATRKIKSWQEH